ncbi:protein kinase family protein [Saccharomonospora marina XMU15]|uniref:non-specific serine/threonine protein kinase n=1 Tax=Saccharomonospora marina XMU15 TaxID=882083 RepID=H5X066_9PSEU|nr:serine/threonine-protein kinase [Saccharomonospora marina]EHR48526.1 protein kinase family protein [Saccharomonospora marina XMU15]
MSEWSLPGFTETALLGEGGFGRVVLARRDATGEHVAIKYLYPRHLGDPAKLAEFRAEAHVLSRVNSPHVARLYQFSETGQGAAIVMEAVAGVSLRAVLSAAGVLRPESALAVLKGSLLGLAAAHAEGIVHRDYKPPNVLVSPDGQSKLVDFGIAVLAGQAGAPVGTPAYMAPEQWSGLAVGPATDVYAATCVFFECVTGRRPYESTDTEWLRSLHQQAPVPSHAAPEAVRGLISRGMAKDARQRPATADLFVAELEAAARSAYGEDWERRGKGSLAARAGVLLAASPLAVLAASSAVAPATGAVMAGAGKGIAAAAGAKIAASVVAAAVVAATATVVVVTNQGTEAPPADGRPSVEQVALQASVRERQEDFGDFTFSGQYVRISGHPDQEIQRRANELLMAPLDDWIEHARSGLLGPDPDGRVPEATTRVEILRQDERVISVRYSRLIASPQFGNRGGYGFRLVTVDLTTGGPLNAPQVFADAASSAAGASLLEEPILAHAGGSYCPGSPQVQAPMSPRFLTEPYTAGGGDPAVQTGFTADGVEFLVYAPAFGHAMACDFKSYVVPYREVEALMTRHAREVLKK